MNLVSMLAKNKFSRKTVSSTVIVQPSLEVNPSVLLCSFSLGQDFSIRRVSVETV